MTDKEKIITYIDKLLEKYPKNYYLLTVAEFIDSLQEEPVSDDLEEAIGQSFIYHENRGDDFRSDEQIETAYRYGFETGANWQKQKGQETIELAEDHAYFAGRTKTIDEMMEKAIETTFNVSLPSSLYDKLCVKGCKEGDKLLVIKKDEL